MKEARLLDAIGIAQMEQMIGKKGNSVYKTKPRKNGGRDWN
jgi:hypothetical protein